MITIDYYWNNVRQQNLEVVLQIIKEIVKRESTDELLFDYLKVLAKNETHEELLDRMIQDERVQFYTLKHIYHQLTGSFPEVDAPTFNIPDSLEEGIREILLRKAKIVKLFVQLVYLLPPIYATYVYPFIVDEQTHMHLLNFILLELYHNN
ncbi:hypothetical protein J2S74_001335 [Evansella vedderi]|uniref:Uncharacterized protein n=1 Tax=Evansella vedderi TaxID=38282 RepID=A0ABT9ZT86_9BACI|nr:hypothetical protein [Evansella vedderi]MDQ0253962.1 hypothetical protein [Evansella vedderi]